MKYSSAVPEALWYSCFKKARINILLTCFYLPQNYRIPLNKVTKIDKYIDKICKIQTIYSPEEITISCHHLQKGY